jgi:hypothetical protein
MMGTPQPSDFLVDWLLEIFGHKIKEFDQGYIHLDFPSCHLVSTHPVEGCQVCTMSSAREESVEHTHGVSSSASHACSLKSIGGFLPLNKNKEHSRVGWHKKIQCYEVCSTCAEKNRTECEICTEHEKCEACVRHVCEACATCTDFDLCFLENKPRPVSFDNQGNPKVPKASPPKPIPQKMQESDVYKTSHQVACMIERRMSLACFTKPWSVEALDVRDAHVCIEALEETFRTAVQSAVDEGKTSIFVWGKPRFNYAVLVVKPVRKEVVACVIDPCADKQDPLANISTVYNALESLRNEQPERMISEGPKGENLMSDYWYARREGGIFEVCRFLRTYPEIMETSCSGPLVVEIAKLVSTSTFLGKFSFGEKSEYHEIARSAGCVRGIMRKIHAGDAKKVLGRTECTGFGG